MNDEYTERQQSEFNFALGYLNLLMQTLILCETSALKLDLFGWFHGLLSVTRQISNHMKTEELDKANNFKKQLIPLISKYNINGKISNEQLYMKLDDYDIFLRMIIKESGLEIKMKDDPRFAMARHG